MPLTGEQRKAKIDLIRQGKSVGQVKIPYRDKSSYEVEVFQIPWDAVIYNQFNDRIGLSLKTKLNPLGTEGLTHEYDEYLHDLIDKELWESAVSANKLTLKSMQGKEKGMPGEQLEAGIITADGVIVDGNRRAMIAKRAGKTFFLAGVLDDLYEGNEEILRDLETQLQFSVESKVDYNPLEKYFKIKTHVEKFGKSYSDLAKLMGPKYSENKLEDMHKIADLMDDYLAFIDSPGCYDLLLISGTTDSKENAFLTLHTKLKQMESGSFATDDYDYSNFSDSYRSIMFNFIRTEAVASPQDYPKYLSNKVGTGLFRSEEFKDEMVKKVGEIMNEPVMELPSIRDLKEDPKNKGLQDIDLVKQRESRIREQTKDKMSELMKEMIGKRLYTSKKLKPFERIEKALQELALIKDEDMDSLAESDGENLDNLKNQMTEMQRKVNLIKKSLGM